MSTASEPIVVNSETALAEAHRTLDKTWREHKYVEIEVRHRARQRTLTQNRAMHLWCKWLAETLNDAGFDMRRTLKHDAEIPWSAQAVKDFLWRPVQDALTSKQSTTEISTTDPTEIHEALTRHLAQRLGIQCPPWPKREEQ